MTTRDIDQRLERARWRKRLYVILENADLIATEQRMIDRLLDERLAVAS